MSLPKINYPTFTLEIPSQSTLTMFRPFLVKEEKILLMAKASEDPADIFRAIKQVVNNCCMADNFDVDKLALFDLEYLFLQIRALSVNNIIKQSYRDNEDNKVYEFEINLHDVKIKFPENIEKNIPITDTLIIKMGYPSASLFDDKEFLNSGDEFPFELVLRCIDMIIDGEDVYQKNDFTSEELEVFLDQLGIAVFDKIRAFIENVPYLNYKIEYKNSLGNDRIIEMKSLMDFFLLG